MSHKPAGGIGSRNVVSKPVKVGAGARGVNTRFVSSVGQSMGNKATEQSGTIPYVREEVYGGGSFRPAPMGNAVAASTVCGPGGSRTVMRSGQQNQWGPVAGPVAGPRRPHGRGILNNE
jgi:hypothetical protein